MKIIKEAMDKAALQEPQAAAAVQKAVPVQEVAVTLPVVTPKQTDGAVFCQKMLTQPGLEDMTPQQASAITNLVLMHLNEVALVAKVGPATPAEQAAGGVIGSGVGDAALLAVPSDDEHGGKDELMKQRAEEEENKRLAEEMNNPQGENAAKAGRTA